MIRRLPVVRWLGILRVRGWHLLHQPSRPSTECLYVFSFIRRKKKRRLTEKVQSERHAPASHRPAELTTPAPLAGAPRAGQGYSPAPSLTQSPHLPPHPNTISTTTSNVAAAAAAAPPLPHPHLDRSYSQRTPVSSSKTKLLDRANTTRSPGSNAGTMHGQGTGAGAGSKGMGMGMGLTKSQSQSGHNSRERERERERDPSREPPKDASKEGSSSGGLSRNQTTRQQQAATPRRREKEKKGNEEVIRQLRMICTPGDPNLVYKNFRKVGQGYVQSHVFLCYMCRWLTQNK